MTATAPTTEFRADDLDDLDDLDPWRRNNASASRSNNPLATWAIGAIIGIVSLAAGAITE